MKDSQKSVIYEKCGQVAKVTLNRPEVLNALDLETHRQLKDIWSDFEADKNLRVAILSGNSERAFSVGQDLKELKQRILSGETPTSFGSKGHVGYPRLTERFDLSKPVIAKVNGYAFGGGFELALACDIIVASKTASFALPEAKLGLIAGAGGVFRLAKLTSAKIASGYLMTGRVMNAERAYELGIVNELCDVEKLDDAVERWVKDILRCAPLSVSSIKEVIAKVDSMSIEKAFVYPFEWEKKRIEGEDCIEGPNAFLEKRKPEWRH